MNEGELLLTDLLNCGRSNLYLNKKYKISPAQGKFLSSVLMKRLRGYPLQYILGKQEFMGFEFNLTRDVLIPRPETEILRAHVKLPPFEQIPHRKEVKKYEKAEKQ